MSPGFEHEGVTYHEPLPRIVLVGLPEAVATLREHAHNVKVCEVKKALSPARMWLESPAPPHEIDVLIVLDQPQYVIRPSARPGEVAPFVDAPFSGEVHWPGGYVQGFRDYCQRILEAAGIVIFHLPEKPDELLAKLGAFATLPGKKLWPGRSAHRAGAGEAQYEALVKFVLAEYESAPVYAALQASVPIAPLLEDADGAVCGFRPMLNAQIGPT